MPNPFLAHQLWRRSPLITAPTEALNYVPNTTHRPIRKFNHIAAPEILENVIALSDRTALLAIRTTCSSIRDYIDAQLARHLVVRNEDIIPFGMDGWHPRLAYLNSRVGRLRRFLRLSPKHHQDTVDFFKEHTYTIDIDTTRKTFMKLFEDVLEGGDNFLVRGRYGNIPRDPMCPRPSSIHTYVIRLPLNGNTLWRRWRLLPPLPKRLTAFHKLVLHVSANDRRIEGHFYDNRLPIEDVVLVIRLVHRYMAESELDIPKYVVLLRQRSRAERLTVVCETADMRDRFKQAFGNPEDHNARCLTLDEYEREVDPERFCLEVEA